MAINAHTLELVAVRRREMDLILDAQTLALVKAWAELWDELAPEFGAAFDSLLGAAKDGRVTGTQVARNVRLRKALTLTAHRLEQLAEQAGQIIGADVPLAALESAQAQITAIQSQLPPAGQVATLPGFTQVSTDAMDAIILRSTQQIHSALLPLADDVVAAMKRELSRGIAVGENPRTVARRIIRRTEGRFNGGLTRAMMISRTELLDSHRAATEAADEANKELMAGWVWIASLDSRTCPSCLSQHGQLHAVTEPGPIDHHSGRCDRMPKTKSWKELGFEGITEPEDIVPDSREWFDNLTADTQRTIMGDTRLELLNSGAIGWDDLSTKIQTPGWRDSIHVTPVKDLLDQANISPALMAGN